MKPKEIKQTKELFPTVDHWLTFNELANKKDAILDYWPAIATEEIRNYFNENMADEWLFRPTEEKSHRNTEWYLKEFGPDSLCLSFSYYYQLHLIVHDRGRFNVRAIFAAFDNKDYAHIKQAFQRIDGYKKDNSLLLEKGNYEFGLPNDRSLDTLELGWATAFHTDAFVEQAIAKIERFINNPQVTEQIRELNRIGREPIALS